MKRIIFDRISIIQSLPNQEFHTGNKIKEDLEVYNAAYSRGLKIDLFDVSTKDMFFNKLNDLTKEALYKELFPVLHIDAHGSSDKEGIVLASNEFISWTDFKPYLINLNIATKMNLLLVFSLCYGGHFASHLTPIDRAPCWGMVGPTKALGANELLINFSGFYREVFSSGSLSQAIKRLNESSVNAYNNYLFTKAVTFFFHVYQTYIEKQCTSKIYESRAKKMRKQLKKEKIYNIPSIGEIKRKLKSSQKDFFENFKTLYFMIDLFPQNANRFIVTYEDVINKAKNYG